MEQGDDGVSWGERRGGVLVLVEWLAGCVRVLAMAWTKTSDERGRSCISQGDWQAGQGSGGVGWNERRENAEGSVRMSRAEAGWWWWHGLENEDEAVLEFKKNYIPQVL